MKQVVESPRLITGLLLEVEARLAVVVCHTDSGNISPEVVMLSLRVGKTPAETVLSFSQKVAPGTQCEVLLSSRRINFSVDSGEDLPDGCFPLPKKVLISDLRTSPRLRLENAGYPAEVRFPGGILLCFAHDVNFDFVTVRARTDISEGRLIPGDTCEVVIRSNLGARDVFFRRCTLINVQKVGDELKFLFSTKKANSQAHYKRSPRRNVSSVSVHYSSDDLVDMNFSGAIQVHDVSLTGFSGTIKTKNIKQQPLLGLVLRSKNPDIAFCAVRRSGDEYGFNILDDGNAARTRSWLNFLQTNSLEQFTQIVSASELAELLIQSNFLKSQRLNVYGGDLDEHLPHTAEFGNSNLVRRFVRADDGEHLSQTISLFRLTDQSWLLHEVAAGVHKKTNIDPMYQEVISLISDESIYLQQSAKFLCVYYHTSVSVITDFWTSLNKGKGCVHFPIQVISLTPSREVLAGLLPGRETNLIGIPLSRRGELAKSFDHRFLTLLDYWTAPVPNQNLNRFLAEIGPSHNTWLRMISSSDNNGDPWAVSYRVNTHYAANTTGVINSLFVFLKQAISRHEFEDVITTIRGSSDQLLGTSDVILVFSDEKGLLNCKYENAREARFMIADLQVLGDTSNEE